MEPPFFLLVVLFIFILAIVGSFYSDKAVVIRKLKNTFRKKTGDFANGDVARITGTVEFVGKPLVAPLSQRPCAYYYIHLEEKRSKHWHTVLEEEVCGKFVIRDGSHCAYLAGNKLKSFLVEDREYSSGFLDEPTTRLKSFLESRGQYSDTFFGFNRNLRYSEGILERSEEITVRGLGQWKDAVELDLPAKYGKVLLISEPPDENVYLTDDPGTVTYNNEPKNYG